MGGNWHKNGTSDPFQGSHAANGCSNPCWKISYGDQMFVRPTRTLIWALIVIILDWDRVWGENQGKMGLQVTFKAPVGPKYDGNPNILGPKFWHRCQDHFGAPPDLMG